MNIWWKRKAVQAALDAAGTLSSLPRFPSLPSPADFLILTAYTPEIAAYGALTAANKSRYAARHGYACKIHTSGFHPGRPPAWSKILFLQQALRHHRWVFWSDADALITNPQVRLESFVQPGIDVHLSQTLHPHPHINTGHMLFRSSPLSLLLLRLAWQLEAFNHDCAWEQAALIYLLDHYRIPRSRLLPNRLFNSLAPETGDPDPWQPGDFIIHFPGVPDRACCIQRCAASFQQPATA